MKFTPYNYQRLATNKIIFQKRIGLFLDMGLGKTVITLTAINYLIKTKEISKVLIIAPLRVAQTTWSDEVEKWDHLNHIKISKILGTAKERIQALHEEANVYIINRENVPWLIEKSKFDYDMVVIDELSSFKSHSSQRFKSLSKVIGKVSRVVGLTGTPTSNGYIDLWSQIFLLDNGERFGKYFTHFRNNYFMEGKRNKRIVFEWKLRPGADKEIVNKISDLCMSMTAKDYLQLPERFDNIVSVEMPNNIKNQYMEFQKESYMEFVNGEATAINGAALINKLLQFSNGAVYDDNKQVQEIHELKLEALSEIVEFANSPVLCFYSYKHDLSRIQKMFPKSVKLDTEESLRAWNKREIPLALCHPMSAGHGLNLQAGGHIIVWFGLPWSLELYQQANARLHRQGQKEPVIIHHIITKETCDYRVYKSLQKKENVQDGVIEYLKGVVK